MGQITSSMEKNELLLLETTLGNLCHGKVQKMDVRLRRGFSRWCQIALNHLSYTILVYSKSVPNNVQV